MSFLNPLFLLGIAALAVPLLIHIINLRRPQSLSFSTLAFFEELKKSTIRRLRIKRYLLLLLRCAAIILLALALARPFLPTDLIGSGGSEQPRAIAILVDNSASMEQIDQGGPFIDQAKKAAEELLENTREKDRFIIQKTNGASFDPRLVSASAARQKLQQIEVEYHGAYLGERLTSLQEQLRQSSFQQTAIYVLSDAQKSQWEEVRRSNFSNKVDEGKRVGLQLVQVGRSQQKNVAISDIALQSRMLSKEKPVSIKVQVRNYSNEPIANQFVSLEMEDEMEGQYQTDIPEGGTKEFLFEFIPESTGSIKGSVVLEGDPVTFDNRRHFILDIPTTRAALLVNKPDQNTEYTSYLPTTLMAAEQTGSQLDYEQVQLSKLTSDDLKGKDVLIFDGVRSIPEFLFSDIQQFVQEGNGLVFLPSEQGDVNNYNKFFRQFNAGKFGGLRGEYANFKSIARLEQIKEGHPIIDLLFDKADREEIKVDRPDIFFNYQYEKRPGGSSLTILRTSIDDPLLVEHAFGDGRIMVTTIGADPGWSNFPVNPLFAPVFYRTILYAASSEKGGLSQHSLGETFTWTGSLPEPVVRLSQGDQTVKPEITQVAEGYRVRYNGYLWSPGWLELSSGTFNKLFALNLSKQESDFEPVSPVGLDSLLGNQINVSGFVNMYESGGDASALNSAGMGREIWHWFIWAALILLMAETFISRWYKTESA